MTQPFSVDGDRPVSAGVLVPVYAAIATCACRGEFSVSDVAREMAMSVRSLQHHARAHDVPRTSSHRAAAQRRNDVTT